MGVYSNRHTRWVALLKVILPLIALGILSTVFLLSGEGEESTATPFSQMEIDEIAREGRISNPTYSGIARDGSVVTLSARLVRQDAETATEADSTIASVEPPDGGRYDLSADAAEIEQGVRRARLTGDVSVRTETGYRLRSDRIDVDLETAEIISPGPVNGQGPAVDLDAGAMRLGLENQSRVLSFTDGVRLVYDPSQAPGN